MRLPRKDLGLEKDEPTQALQMGVPAADSTVRLKRDELSFEEPTVSLKAPASVADSTVRLKRDELSFEEPTVALKAPASAADSTLRLKREEMSLEEPTEILERPRLRTAMEVIDEATQAETPRAKPTVMMPDATDIPSWEETTQLYTPPSGGQAGSKESLSRPALVDPSASMDETFPNASSPTQSWAELPEPLDAANPQPGTTFPEPGEDTLVLPDMHELDELPNAMKATLVMPVMEAPAAPQAPEPMEATAILHREPQPGPMDKTVVMPVMEAPAAPQAPEPMEATTILHMEPPSEPMDKTMVMPVMEATAAPQAPEPMEATAILHREPQPGPMDKTVVMRVMEAPAAPQAPEPMEATAILHAEPPPGPMDKTMVMSVMEAPAAPQAPEPMEATAILPMKPQSEPMDKTMVMPVMEAPAAPQAPEPMEATAIMPVVVDEPSAYLTRQGQSPWPSTSDLPEASPVSTKLVSAAMLSQAMLATSGNQDSALAPVAPEVTAMAGDSPLAKATDVPVPSAPLRLPPPEMRRDVDTSIGMAVTPPTLLMPIHPPLDPTVPVKRPTPSSAAPAEPRPAAHTSQPISKQPQPPQPPQPKRQPEPVATGIAGPAAALSPPSVPGYPDRQIPAPVHEPKFQTKPMPAPARPAVPARVPVVPQAEPAQGPSKIWVPASIGALLLIIGGIYFAFFRTSLKSGSSSVALPSMSKEPSLPVPVKLQGDLAKAKAGDSKAMHILGVSFFYGLDVPQNKAEGLRWMRKAAEAGNEKAKSDLRQMESGSR